MPSGRSTGEGQLAPPFPNTDLLTAAWFCHVGEQSYSFVSDGSDLCRLVEKKEKMTAVWPHKL